MHAFIRNGYTCTFEHWFKSKQITVWIFSKYKNDFRFYIIVTPYSLMF